MQIVLNNYCRYIIYHYCAFFLNIKLYILLYNNAVEIFIPSAGYLPTNTLAIHTPYGEQLLILFLMFPLKIKNLTEWD